MSFKFHFSSIATQVTNATWLLIALWITVTPQHAIAQSDEAKGRWIFDQFDLSKIGFQDYTVIQTISTNFRGKESSKTFRQYGIEKKEGNKTLVVFDTPKESKGTALLTWHHHVGDDDQWLFLPNLKRIKKISTAGKKTPYVGSAFSYEDVAILSRQHSTGFNYKYLRDDTIDNTRYYVVEGFPTGKKSGYSKIEFWLDDEAYRIPKMLFFDKKGKHVKTLAAKDFQLYLEKYWQPVQLTMTDHKKKKTSTILSRSYQFKTGLNENIFNRSGLARFK